MTGDDTTKPPAASWRYDGTPWPATPGRYTLTIPYDEVTYLYRVPEVITQHRNPRPGETPPTL